MILIIFIGIIAVAEVVGVIYSIKSHHLFKSNLTKQYEQMKVDYDRILNIAKDLNAAVNLYKKEHAEKVNNCRR